jgi:branched-chain amino acid aminotransferase
VNDSAEKLFLKPTVSVDEWVKLAKEGIGRFDKDAALYIRPMYWAERGGPWIQEPDPDSTRWCLSIFEAPMRKPTGFSITLSQFRRPTIESMPVNAKAGCLSRGFDNAVMCDLLGNVAELATSNIFMGKEGVVYTPAINGTFLAGITRQRVIGLLCQDGVTVVEKTLRYGDFQAADEIFSTGNYSKVVPVTRIDDRPLPMGPLYTRARELYWAFAHSRGVAVELTK